MGLKKRPKAANLKKGVTFDGIVGTFSGIAGEVLKCMMCGVSMYFMEVRYTSSIGSG